MNLILNVANVSKSFRCENQTGVILNDFCLIVDQGSIYCLLGASGCGKSTLISCILGLQKIDSGVIKIFQNQQVIYKQLIRSSNLIGYMPQETALPMLMSIKETMNYFANISQMDMRLFKGRCEVLLNMLELTNKNAIIEDLSGGEQRKVSLAVALIHDPKFVILDEPTVGLDVTICHKIWNFLDQSRGRLTVLMTTHYPHEAEKADVCGYMRNGKLLADGKPQIIMNTLNVASLDEACLMLCNDHKDYGVKKPIKFSEGYESNANIDEIKRSSMQVIKALVTKKMILLKRSKLSSTIVLLTPIFTFILLILVFGRDPQGLKVGIVNDDCNCLKTFKNEEISCKFINKIPENALQKVIYNSIEDASEDLKKAEIVGFIHMPKNFSDEFMRIRTYFDITPSSQIAVHTDQSDIYKNIFAKGILSQAYEDFVQEMMDSKYKVFINNLVVENYQKNMEIKVDSTVARFVIPSMYLLTIVFLSMLFSGSSIICDKFESVWNRSLLCGADINHLMIVEIILATLLTLIQLIETILIKMVFVNFIEIEDYLAFCCVFACIGMVGCMHGLVLGTFCKNLLSLVSGAFGLMIVFFFTNGILHPLELMNPYVRAILEILPIGLPSSVFRDIIFKGYDLSFQIVQKALLLSASWIIGLIAISYIHLRKYKYFN